MQGHNAIVLELTQALFHLKKGIKPEKDFPLKHGEMSVLIFISKLSKKNGKGGIPSQIGAILGLSRPAVTPILNGLEEQGFITRTMSKEDRRVHEITLTQKGEELVKTLFESFNKSIFKLVEGLGEKDSKELLRLLKRSEEILSQIDN